MADCCSLPNAAELVEKLEHILSLNDDDLAALVLRNNDVQNAIILMCDKGGRMKDKFSFVFTIVVIACVVAVSVLRTSEILEADIPLWLKLSLLR